MSRAQAAAIEQLLRSGPLDLGGDLREQRPSAFDDASEAYRGLLATGIDPMDVVVAGESAGGGLALALLMGLSGRGLPRPAAAVLFPPWADLTVSGRSATTHATVDPALTPSGLRTRAADYAGGTDPAHAVLSPLFGRFTGLPPLLVRRHARARPGRCRTCRGRRRGRARRGHPGDHPASSSRLRLRARRRRSGSAFGCRVHGPAHPDHDGDGVHEVDGVAEPTMSIVHIAGTGTTPSLAAGGRHRRRAPLGIRGPDPQRGHHRRTGGPALRRPLGPAGGGCGDRRRRGRARLPDAAPRRVRA
ncbi:alpha/beta hydrolase fold domain-containing protein [Pseudonocardia sp. HH130629-09]|uniref:alpha/beta hydrolase fold domain-containing protein n=1 Tax=Pseudonocardia sp. HH130629-09 TaxID=1641402 RepID=UPI0019310921|nr:alpha/beta hydrolase fold domain-containing protein [Pseudonocardia sp. HH130629-09]